MLASKKTPRPNPTAGALSGTCKVSKAEIAASTHCNYYNYCTTTLLQSAVDMILQHNVRVTSHSRRLTVNSLARESRSARPSLNYLYCSVHPSCTNQSIRLRTALRSRKEKPAWPLHETIPNLHLENPEAEVLNAPFVQTLPESLPLCSLEVRPV